MKFRHLIALALVLQFTLSSLAQQPTQTAPGASPANPQQPGLQPDDEVVKITTNLVQVDAVVTDKNDRQITDLRPDELEIFEDGKPQQITNFSYVSTEDGRAKPTEQSQRDSQREAKAIGPVPPIRLRQEQVRRTIALVVDDLGLSFLSISTVRQALKKFVDQQMQPGDLVAIIRTSGGIGALQQFTSDKRVLYAAIEKIRWSVTSRGGIAVFAPMAAELESKSLGDTPATAAAHEDLDQFREELYTVGTLGALNYIVRGLRALPGRKSVILLSDGMTVFNLQKTGVIERQSSRVIEAQKRLVDLANRASVVIYTIDPRGIPTFGLQASDDVSNMSDADIQATLTKRSHDFADSQAALGYLAQETGGLEIKNQNDISGGLRRVLDDQRGYYLIGYRPDESTFDKPGRIKFHHLSLRVKRPGKFNIRLRSGFLGVTQAQAVPTRTTRDQQLLGALVSPFGAENVHLRSTSLFARDTKGSPIMRSIVKVDPHDLTFTTEPDGSHKAVIDILAVTFGDNGQIVDQIGRTHTITLKDKTYDRIMNNGLTYDVAVPIKKPGAYQLRTAVRDVASERVGSTSQFVEVPDLKKNRLTLSGLLLKGVPLQTYLKSGRGAVTNADDGIEETDAEANTAVRRFKSGMVMLYGLDIYNAQINKQSGKPNLQTQVRLFRDGKLVFTGKETPFEPGNQSSVNQLNTVGAMHLGTELEAGEYVLQLLVTDLQVNGKYRVASQSIDFEIVR